MTNDHQSPLLKIFSDGVVTLKPLVARDAGELYLLVSDNRQALGLYMPWVQSTQSIADMSFYIASLTGFWEGGHTFAIFVEGELIGTIGFHAGSRRHHCCDIGYWLNPSHQGQGFGARSLSLALNLAFEHTEVHRLVARIDEENSASIALVKKFGFQFEGIARGGSRFGKDYRDHQVYSLLRTDHTAP